MFKRVTKHGCPRAARNHEVCMSLLLGGCKPWATLPRKAGELFCAAGQVQMGFAMFPSGDRRSAQGPVCSFDGCCGVFTAHWSEWVLWFSVCFRLPFTFVTKEVADATCECLLAQAEQAEKLGKSKAAAERMILEEFGRCLMRVINSAGKSKSDPCAMNCWRVHKSHNEVDWTEHLRHRDTLVWHRGFNNTC